MSSPLGGLKGESWKNISKERAGGKYATSGENAVYARVLPKKTGRERS